MDAPTQQADSAKPRYTFSLLNLLLGSALLVAVISHVVASRELGQLRSDVKRIRNEMGYLEITDRSKCYVNSFHQLEPGRYVFHIYLPPGHRYVRKYSITETLKGSDHTQTFASPITESGEFTLQVIVFRDRAGAPQVRMRGLGDDGLFPLGMNSAFAAPSNFSEKVPSFSNLEIRRGDPFRLLTLHALKEGTANHRSIFHLWLEEEVPKTGLPNTSPPR
jgi:hypothetical protein